MVAADILNFWFEEIESASHWKKDPVFDQLIVDRFSEVHGEARQSALFDWRRTTEGRLAEIIVLDQFSRNMFRDKPMAFAQDPLALCLAQEAVSLGILEKLSEDHRSFLLMPYMHSESLRVHDEAMVLFEEWCGENMLKYEIAHRDIIVRFGRYPHRNEILGRASTLAEIEFLKGPGSSF